MTATEREHMMSLAIGRLFRLMSRPEIPGDVAEYHRVRSIILDMGEPVADNRPNWTRDRLNGAAGD